MHEFWLHLCLKCSWTVKTELPSKWYITRAESVQVKVVYQNVHSSISNQTFRAYANCCSDAYKPTHHTYMYTKRMIYQTSNKESSWRTRPVLPSPAAQLWRRNHSSIPLALGHCNCKTNKNGDKNVYSNTVKSKKNNLQKNTKWQYTEKTVLIKNRSDDFFPHLFSSFFQWQYI